VFKNTPLVSINTLKDTLKVVYDDKAELVYPKMAPKINYWEYNAADFPNKEIKIEKIVFKTTPETQGALKLDDVFFFNFQEFLD
jgi:hypothetical protein